MKRLFLDNVLELCYDSVREFTVILFSSPSNIILSREKERTPEKLGASLTLMLLPPDDGGMRGIGLNCRVDINNCKRSIKPHDIHRHENKKKNYGEDKASDQLQSNCIY